MSKLYLLLHTHFYYIIHTPKRWWKYIIFCLRHNKTPNTRILARMLKLKEITDTFR